MVKYGDLAEREIPELYIDKINAMDPNFVSDSLDISFEPYISCHIVSLIDPKSQKCFFSIQGSNDGLSWVNLNKAFVREDEFVDNLRTSFRYVRVINNIAAESEAVVSLHLFAKKG